MNNACTCAVHVGSLTLIIDVWEILFSMSKSLQLHMYIIQPMPRTESIYEQEKTHQRWKDKRACMSNNSTNVQIKYTRVFKPVGDWVNENMIHNNLMLFWVNCVQCSQWRISCCGCQHSYFTWMGNLTFDNKIHKFLYWRVFLRVKLISVHFLVLS